MRSAPLDHTSSITLSLTLLHLLLYTEGILAVVLTEMPPDALLHFTDEEVHLVQSFSCEL